VRWLVGFVLLAASCEALFEPYKDQHDVYCVLRTDSTGAFALVGRTCGFEEWPYEWTGVSDATVEVWQGGDTFLFWPHPETAGVYLCDSLPVFAGQTYGLRVQSGLGTVHGTTTVPDSVSFVLVTADTVLSGTGEQSILLGVEWKPCPGGFQYELVARFVYLGETGSEYSRYRWARLDSCRTTLIAPLRYSGSELRPLTSVGLEIRALDHNYRDYLLLQQEYGYRSTLMHLDGGPGVFGSMSVAETTVSLTLPSRR
jgi:hypothetical protein